MVVHRMLRDKQRPRDLLRGQSARDQPHYLRFAVCKAVRDDVELGHFPRLGRRNYDHRLALSPWRGLGERGVQRQPASRTPPDAYPWNEVLVCVRDGVERPLERSGCHRDGDRDAVPLPSRTKGLHLREQPFRRGSVGKYPAFAVQHDYTRNTWAWSPSGRAGAERRSLQASSHMRGHPGEQRDLRSPEVRLAPLSGQVTGAPRPAVDEEAGKFVPEAHGSQVLTVPHTAVKHATGGLGEGLGQATLAEHRGNPYQILLEVHPLKSLTVHLGMAILACAPAVKDVCDQVARRVEGCDAVRSERNGPPQTLGGPPQQLRTIEARSREAFDLREGPLVRERLVLDTSDHSLPRAPSRSPNKEYIHWPQTNVIRPPAHHANAPFFGGI